MIKSLTPNQLAELRDWAAKRLGTNDAPETRAHARDVQALVAMIDELIPNVRHTNICLLANRHSGDGPYVCDCGMPDLVSEDKTG